MKIVLLQGWKNLLLLNWYIINSIGTTARALYRQIQNSICASNNPIIMGTQIEVWDNKELMRFETGVGDDIAYLEYRYYKKINIALMHTVVPETMKGKGIASALAEYAFQYARDNNKLVMVYCPFVAAYVKRHPEVKELLNKEFLG